MSRTSRRPISRAISIAPSSYAPPTRTPTSTCCASSRRRPAPISTRCAPTPARRARSAGSSSSSVFPTARRSTSPTICRRRLPGSRCRSTRRSSARCRRGPSSRLGARSDRRRECEPGGGVGALLPRHPRVAQWTHLTGVQPFEPEDEYFIGLTAQWNVWNWGATQDGVNPGQGRPGARGDHRAWRSSIR